MKVTKAKTATIYAAAILLVVISAFILTRMDFHQWELKEQSLGQIKLDRTAKTLLYLQQTQTASKDAHDRHIQAELDFMTAALAEYVTEEGYTGPRLFNGGAVVELLGGRALWPEGVPDGFLALGPEDVKRGGAIAVEPSPDEASDTGRTTFASAPIGASYYYVSRTDDALPDAPFTDANGRDFMKAAALPGTCCWSRPGTPPFPSCMNPRPIPAPLTPRPSA